MTRIDVSGCRPTPLSSYLKALGLFRIVGEQLDPEVRASWVNDTFVLSTSKYDEHALQDFLLYRYRPTPISDPWNGGSGYYPKDIEPQKLVRAIAESSAPRLAMFRDVIREIHHILEELQLVEKPNSVQKRDLLVSCRNRLSDEAIRWLDAAVVMTSTDMRWPPLLGVGGNDGRLEFSANFLKHILAVMDADGKPTRASAGWLSGALYGGAVPGLVKSAVGQFDPGSAGGPNTAAGFEGEARVNPWDFILAMEGAILFAAASTHRLGRYANDMLSYPFTVQVAGAGQAALVMEDESASRAEMWLPLWGRPATYLEIRRMFEEGRSEVFQRRAADAVDFAVACASLGVDRGIDAFHRYAFLNRAGKSYFAVPLTRVMVKRNPRTDLLRDLDDHGWLQRAQRYARKEEAPAEFRKAIRALDDGIFALCQDGHPGKVNHLLMVLGDLERIMSTSKKSRDALPPLWLNAGWIEDADHKAWSFRIALAMASMTGAQGNGMRHYISPVGEGKMMRQWMHGTIPDMVWASSADLTDNMVALLNRRLLNAAVSVKLENAEQGAVPDKHAGNPFAAAYPASLNDVMQFLSHGQLDRDINRLVRGLSLVRFHSVNLPRLSSEGNTLADFFVPGAYAAIKLMFVPDILKRTLNKPDLTLPVPPALSGLLRSGQIAKAARASVQRLRHSGVAVPFESIQAPALLPQRLAASMVVPIRPRDVRHLCRVLHCLS